MRTIMLLGALLAAWTADATMIDLYNTGSCTGNAAQRSNLVGNDFCRNKILGSYESYKMIERATDSPEKTYERGKRQTVQVGMEREMSTVAETLDPTEVSKSTSA